MPNKETRTKSLKLNSTVAALCDSRTGEIGQVCFGRESEKALLLGNGKPDYLWLESLNKRAF